MIGGFSISEQDKLHKPFDSAFKTLVAACPKLLIPLVNELFGTAFTEHDEVVLMDSKLMKPVAMGKIATREVDSLFTINGKRKMTFHVECQSNPDDTMVARFWEYDSNIALKNAEITPDGKMRVRFPQSAVLYLRHSANTPDKLTVEIEDHRGDVFGRHQIPVVKTQKYELDELFRKELLFLFPFYSFRHEKRLSEYDADENKFAVLREDLARMIQKLNEDRNAERIDGMIMQTIQSTIISVLRGLGGEHSHVMKGVEEMLEGQILDLEVFRIHDKAWEEGNAAGLAAGEAAGLAAGEAAGELKTYIGLVRDNIVEPSVAAARLRISESEFRAKCDAASANVS